MKRWANSGAPWVWLSAASVAVSLLALIGILALLAGQGMRYFWPSPVYQFELNQSAAGPVTVIGELYQQQSISRRQLQAAGITMPAGDAPAFTRYLIKVGNRESSGQDFRTLLADDVRRQTAPRDLIVLERNSNGTAYGYLVGLLEDGQPLTGRDLGHTLMQRLPQIAALSRQAYDIQFRAMAQVNQHFESLRLREKSLAAKNALDAGAQAAIKAERTELQRQYRQLADALEGLNRDRYRDALQLRDMSGQIHTIPLIQVRDAWYPNTMSFGQKVAHWAAQVKKFLTDSPREANTEGGVFPAIFGTVLMVILMSIVVMPFGVIAAVYLHEYAGNNLLTRLIRISVVNLAGVPSIVYGVFGLGFFVYMIGGSIDQLFYAESLPNPTFGTPGVLWAALTLALLTLPVVIVATEEGLSRIPVALRQGSLALGASRAETLWHIVLPMAAPAMMTGLILAVARAAGETAPLMLVGVVKSVPVLPVDGIFPYLHLERKFMHLSFQIYDMAFQSPSVEAA
ncbi:phosphate ABC transporter permease PstA, partial [Gibbsiella quercinecans]